MKKSTETERLEHVGNWKKSKLSKAAYAKSAGIFPTTFYTWTRGTADNEAQAFAELPRQTPLGDKHELSIEKGSITVRVPLSASVEELQAVFSALGTT